MMSPVQLDPIDKPKSEARRKVSRRIWSLMKVGLIVLLTVIFLDLRLPYLPSFAEMFARPNPQIGPKNASVTIVEFGDYACSACRIWAQAGMRQQLLSKYGDKVRFVWADFPVITLESSKAAEAGRCAYDQGKFWEYQDYVYNNYQGIENAALKFYAIRVGLDKDVFDKCLDSGSKADEVNIDFKDAMNRFIGGTPTFIINNKVMISGMASMDQFAAVIDPMLAGAR